ncbi:MAG: Hint domain-containing protein [Pikeienuella sp.]
MIENTDNVGDSGTLELNNVQVMTTGVVDGETFVFAAGNDDGISVFRLESDNTLTSIFDINDNNSLFLNNVRELEFVEIGGNPILVVGSLEDAISTFSVDTDGTLVELDQLEDDGSLLLNNVLGMTTVDVGGTLFAVTTNSQGGGASANEGISTFSIDSNGIITTEDQIDALSIAGLELDSARDVESIVVDGTTFVIAGGLDDGLSVFSIDSSGTLTNEFNVADDATLLLDTVRGIATATVDGSAYVYAAGNDGGISVFEIDNTGTLTSVENLADDADTEINNIHSIETIVGPSGEKFLFVVGNDDALDVFFIEDDGTLTQNNTFLDDASTFIGNARDVAITVEDGTLVAIAGGNGEDGISVFTVPCFTPGAMIRTLFGLTPVEEIIAGDLIATRDNGYQPVRYVARRKLKQDDLAKAPHLKPIIIRKGSLGEGRPNQDLMVSPQHRMLICGFQARVMFESEETLAPALALVNDKSIRVAKGKKQVEYIHLVFDQHEIVWADGAVTESFYPGAEAMNGLDQKVKDELFEIFPEFRMGALGGFGPPARPLLKRYEAEVFTSRTRPYALLTTQ